MNTKLYEPLYYRKPRKLIANDHEHKKERKNSQEQKLSKLNKKNKTQLVVSYSFNRRQGTLETAPDVIQRDPDCRMHLQFSPQIFTSGVCLRHCASLRLLWELDDHLKGSLAVAGCEGANELDSAGGSDTPTGMDAQQSA